MAIALAPKPSASQKRPLSRRTIVLLAAILLIAVAGLIAGVKLESIHAEQERELNAFQSEESAREALREHQLQELQEADARRMLLEAHIELQEERLKNRDGFLR